MKATGIVRRVEARVIIGKKSKNRINTMDFADFCPTQFTQNNIYIAKARGNSPRFCVKTHLYYS